MIFSKEFYDQVDDAARRIVKEDRERKTAEKAERLERIREDIWDIVRNVIEKGDKIK